ncbi:hypothetical protein [Polyangium sp. 15x6]|uniref:hypothetical protein n=1 Tax=Polyangium sp. 15x6 TaxID=3042687 RepID=UPI00249A861D|nr:hypothetical protein [Polyangium sp. 15x6]MDI3291323.1 hypothetical protein [Polyangium sp. 15x6]
MAEGKSARRGLRKTSSVLGPGLHPGRIEMAMATSADGDERAYRVRLASGRHLTARLDGAVARDFAEECLRGGRTVVLVDGPDGPRIAGALQVASALEKDERGTLALEAKHLRVRADQSIVLEVPGGSLAFEPGGALRLEGDKLVIDMAALVRIFAARVELP